MSPIIFPDFTMNSRKHNRETEQILSAAESPDSLISYTLSMVIGG